MFYGIDRVENLHPILKKYKDIDNPKALFFILNQLWSKDTCAPRMQKDWTKSNNTLGQCSITAFLVQDIFGGQVYGVDLKDGNFHCFNVIDDITFDLTSAQFSYPLIYSLEYIQSRDKHFQKQ